MERLAAVAEGSADTAHSFADPVFVLCNARSGSTLLRFLLDAHPEIACPPETNMPSLCAQLATVWSLIEGAPLSSNRGDEPPDIPDAAIRGVRETMDRMIGSYLMRRGKQRYCDKSLGTARFAELMLRVYPGARFICLYRHPMDVIVSGMEACPWGLNGYGFDSYAATTPGNSVMALARYWADNTAVTLAAEEQFPEHCMRVRYEDLVTDTEETAARIFRFLDVAPAPGISRACLSPERERFGPGDYKIWYTTEISTGSIARGWSIPTALIGPPLLAAVNEMVGKLSYRQVDASWGTSAPPADVRLPVGDAEDPATALAGESAIAAVAGRAAEPGTGPLHSQPLGARLQAGLREAGVEAVVRWQPHATETLVAISVPEDPREPAEYWLVDLEARTAAFTSRTAQENSDWDIIGSADTWQELLAGKLNLSVAIRSCLLRYCENDETVDDLAGNTRIGIIADLLAIPHL